MEDSVQDQQELQQEDTMPLESTALLNSVAEAGSCDVVKELTSDSDLSVKDRQSFLLQKLATVSGLSHQIIEEILKKLFSSEARAQTLKNSAQTAIVAAANCENWDILMIFLMIPYTLLNDEPNLLSVIEMVDKSQTLRSNWSMHIDVLSSVWRHSKQKILDSIDKRVPNTLVQLAAELNMWSRVCDLLVTKPDLNLLDRDGLSVLHRLIMCPDSRFDSLLPVLLENGADFNLKTKKGETVLHIAAKYQKVEYVSECVQQVDTKDCESLTPKIASKYHIKCAKSKQQMVSKLIDMCHELDDCDSLGNTPVILAAENNNEGLLRLLLEHGARTDVVDEEQRSVLHVLALKGSSMVSDTYTTLISLCVNNGVQMNSPDINGLTALHLAVKSHNWTFMKSLVNFGADTGRPDGEGYNVLHRLAMTSEQLDNVCQLFDLLHQRGCDLNAECRAGDTVLHLAAMIENLKLVKHLIGLVTSLDRCNKQGFTILHLLAIYKLRPPEDGQSSPDEVCLLLADLTEGGGQMNVVTAANCENWDILMIFLMIPYTLLDDEPNLLSVIEMVDKSETLRSKWCMHIDVLSSVWRHSKQKILDSTDKRVPNTLVQLAAELNMWSRVCDLFVTKPDLNLLDRDGLSVLHRLIMCPDSRFDSLLPVLLENGADFNLKTKKGETVLHIAAKYQKVEYVSECVQQVDTKDCERLTPKIVSTYHIKCAKSKQQMVSKLIDMCHELDDCDHLGNTPVILAAENNNEGLLRLLLEHGARTDLVDEEQRSVLHVLALKGSSMVFDTCTTLISLCVNNGVQMNNLDINGLTALHLAVKSHNWTFMKSLVNFGADTGRPDGEGYNVLHRLAMTSAEQLDNVCQLFDLLHQRGCDLNAECRAGNTVLHLAAMTENLKLVKHLTEFGTRLDRCNRQGFTILHLLAIYKLRPPQDGRSSPDEIRTSQNIMELSSQGVQKADDDILPESTVLLNSTVEAGNWELVKDLLSNGDNNASDAKNSLLLQKLASAKCISLLIVRNILRKLFEDEADSQPLKHIAEEMSLSPTHRLVMCPDSRFDSLLPVLLENGADVTLKTCKGDTTLHLAATHQNTVRDRNDKMECTDIKSKIMNEYHTKRAEAKLQALTLLLTSAKTLDDCDSKGNTAAILAAKNRNWEFFKLLLEHGARADVVGECQRSLLHVLVLTGSSMDPVTYKTLVTLCVSSGAIINARDADGCTAMHLAACSNKWTLFRILADLGADTRLTDADGYNVLHRLAMTSSEQAENVCQLFHFLHQQGADLNAQCSAAVSREGEERRNVWASRFSDLYFSSDDDVPPGYYYNSDSYDDWE
ncbi:hypothetical protein C0Q70_12230 [Pomacea canaliculata]|uniref:Uncharacterized protein n=1 Tax=Pomacea canaliculata TaxID=400727 RepID=A0A2T7P0Y1_POMCA|nr:hypothetical protein C0Q70_12230 [Pomacea canaliculata]